MINKLLILLVFLFFANNVLAYSPQTPNNKFGIHLAQPHLEDLEKANELVNSNGGDWGYVTLVIQENDRDKGKWQEIFDKMRELHLIPIIRLATIAQGNQWRRPQKEDAESWVEFLNSLHWVIKDRFIILFNEPNHGVEWGGRVDAKNYADVALEFAKKLKEKNSDFFVMLAGLDASAPDSLPLFQDEAIFLNQFFNSVTIDQPASPAGGFNNLFSGFASHSYPNPAFAGSPYDIGRGTVRTYQWELQVLQSLGVSKDLPVFITETGWDRMILGEDLTASNLKTSFENIWLPDERVVAITPFVLDYQGEPFLNFSWKLPSARASQGQEFYLQYYIVKSIAKTRGKPEQIEKGEAIFDLPKELVAHSSFHFTVKLKNLGQAIWDKNDNYQLMIINDQQKLFDYFFSDIKNVKPFEEAEIDFYLKTNGLLGKKKVQIVLKKEEKTIVEANPWEFELFPLPSLDFSTSLLPKLNSNGGDFELQIFNERDELVFKKNHIEVKKGKGIVEEIQNVALGRKYRVVILKPFYLPRQNFVIFRRGKNSVLFEKMLPLDFDSDGKLEFQDLFSLIKNPQLFTLLLP